MSLCSKVFCEKDVERFFHGLFGHESKFASADQFLEHLSRVEENEQSENVNNLALLHRHAGMVLLDQENPAKAEIF